MLSNVMSEAMISSDSLGITMEYHEWIEPRNFQDDPDFLGKVFATRLRESGHESTLCALATEVWTRQQVTSGHSVNDGLKALLDVREPFFGKRNVLYRVRMPDKLLWMARLYNSLRNKSAIQDQTQRHVNQSLLFESEVASMRFIKEKTKIPVPAVYGYDTTHNNALGTPYIFMEFIPGKPYPFPFDARGPVKDRQLLKIHAQLTNFAWQLLKNPFDKIGQLRFSPYQGAQMAVGPIVDRKDRIYGPFTSSKAFYEKRARTVHDSETCRGSSEASSETEDSIGSAALHVLAAKHAGVARFNTGPFILQHADLHWQNLLFDEECTIVGVIDWEWTQTVPLDSFNILPFNFASKMLPYQLNNVDRDQQILLHLFGALSETEGIDIERHVIEHLVSLQNSQHRQIVQYLDEYNWPEARKKHSNHFREIVFKSQHLSFATVPD
ncbi:MAG: hypothetical protein M1831_004788 [Alyxoria varia]|nr:MAG: hypothetical protein M1831_004788 [Alyxoria varia]